MCASSSILKLNWIPSFACGSYLEYNICLSSRFFFGGSMNCLNSKSAAAVESRRARKTQNVFCNSKAHSLEKGNVEPKTSNYLAFIIALWRASRQEKKELRRVRDILAGLKVINILSHQHHVNTSDATDMMEGRHGTTKILLIHGSVAGLWLLYEWHMWCVYVSSLFFVMCDKTEDWPTAAAAEKK